MSQWNNRFHVLEDLEPEPSNKIPTPKKQSSDEIKTMSEDPSSFSSLPERIYIRTAKMKFSTQLNVQLKTLDTGVRISLTALLDSGATGLFLDSKFVKENNLNTRRLPRAIPVYNVDGTLNQGGSIQEEVDMVIQFNNHTEKATFAVCELGDKAAIIGHTWLFQHNPEIDWQTGEVKFTRCPPHCHVQVKRDRLERKKKRVVRKRKLPTLLHDDEEEDNEEKLPDDPLPMDDKEDRLFLAFIHPQETINATSSVSQRLAQDSHKHDERKMTFEEMVPKRYHEFKGVFSKESFDELPARKPWDHAIELKFESEPFKSKIYPLLGHTIKLTRPQTKISAKG